VSEAPPTTGNVEQRLDPRYVQLHRQLGWIVALFIAGSSLLIILIVSIVSFSWWGFLGRAVLWTLVTAFLIWHAQHWPAVVYRHTTYRLDDQVFEIRRGVYWRQIVSVPRSRVQHTDVSQGPLERTHGLGTLVVYTAGTDHAKVDLQGLSYETALSLREQLLPREGGDAV
jgi:membrane protein YdbS with pleckstrin-like domain